MDIKEIAPKLTQKLSIAINDDEAVEFAEALIAEVQKQNKPVVWWNKDTCQFFIGEIADVERKDLFEPLYAFPPIPEPQWQPIETAPKDAFVLLAGPSGYTTIKTVFATGRMCSDYHKGRWIDYANDDLADWGFEPTHWMPLPEAPKGEQK